MLPVPKRPSVALKNDLAERCQKRIWPVLRRRYIALYSVLELPKEGEGDDQSSRHEIHYFLIDTVVGISTVSANPAYCPDSFGSMQDYYSMAYSLPSYEVT
jgi:hypothetical protein